MIANDVQHGGTHYKNTSGEQHWDRVWRMHGRGYFVGCATKYIERYHLKNGKQDLEKAIHFLQKLIELEYSPKETEAKYKVAAVTKTREEAYEGDATYAYVNQD